VLAISTDERADIFSAGATFYHLMTGRVPEDATKRTLAVWEGQSDPLLHASDVNTEISRPIGDVLMTAMAVDCDDRFDTAAEMLDALDRAALGQSALRQEPVEMSPEALDAAPLISAEHIALVIDTVSTESPADGITVEIAAESNVMSEVFHAAPTHAFTISKENLLGETEEFLSDPFADVQQSGIATVAFPVSNQTGEERIYESALNYPSPSELESPLAVDDAGFAAASMPPLQSDGAPIPDPAPNLSDEVLLQESSSNNENPTHIPRPFMFGAAPLAEAVIASRQSVFGRAVIVGFVSLALLLTVGGALWYSDMVGFFGSAEQSQKQGLPAMGEPGGIRVGAAGIEMVYVSPGQFSMGSSQGNPDEKPVHSVSIEEGFWMGRFEVTQSQWQEIMSENPSKFSDCGGNCPIEQVSWDDVQTFLRRLNTKEEIFRYRLPSESEWEYAARAGTTTAFSFGDSLNSEQANFDGNFPVRSRKGPYLKRTAPVGTYAPNQFGLFDMHGNVWEWVQDNYSESYADTPRDGRANPLADPSVKVVRGGAWSSNGIDTRSSLRFKDNKAHRMFNLGFRVVATIANPQ